MTGWLLDTTDATGAILNRKIADAQYDRSIGFVNLICEDYIELGGIPMSYTLPNRQTFDVVYDKLKELLELYSDSMPKDYQYKIIIDNPRAVTNFTGRGIFMHWAGNSDIKNNRGQYDYTAKYFFDCVSAMQGRTGFNAVHTAGEIAAKSTRYLVTQVFDVFTHYVNDNFGFPVGTIGNKRMYIEQADPTVTLPSDRYPLAGLS